MLVLAQKRCDWVTRLSGDSAPGAYNEVRSGGPGARSREDVMNKRRIVQVILTLGWIPTLAVLIGTRGASEVAALAQTKTPIKVTRLYTGPDGKTKVEEYEVPLKPQGRGTELSSTVSVKSLQFRRTNQDYNLDWHPAPTRQYVITLSG